MTFYSDNSFSKCTCNLKFGDDNILENKPSKKADYTNLEELEALKAQIKDYKKVNGGTKEISISVVKFHCCFLNKQAIGITLLQKI